MCTRNELDNILKKIVEIYRSVYGESVVRIVLYGSYARNDFTAESDVDVAAIVHGDRRLLQEKLKLVWDQASDLSLEYDVVLSPTVIPYEEFETFRESLPYYRNIDKEGIPIGA